MLILLFLNQPRTFISHIYIFVWVFDVLPASVGVEGT